MPDKHIPSIMDIIDNIVSSDSRRRKYSDKQILKILVLLQIFNISYRSSGIFLRNHIEYMELIGIKDIPSFQTLSRRSRSLDIHAINKIIQSMYSVNEIAAFDSFMIHTCKQSTAERRRKYRNYKDPLSGWSKTTKGWSYGRKCHMSIDVDSLLINEWIITSGNVHDSSASHEMIDSVRNYRYILANSAYDTSEIYDYIFENAHSLPVIDTNKRGGIINDRLTVNRRIGIELRKGYSSMYSMRWEIERTFSILDGIMGSENIWYVSNRDYDNIIGLKVIAYNLMLISNIEYGDNRREIMKIVSC